MNHSPVPVIMYHSIGIPNEKWKSNYLTCHYSTFENQLKWIKNRFNTISLMDLYEYMDEGKKLPTNPVVLTFDDGYLDNWVFAYPLIKKYGLKATIYVNPEFTDNRKIIRNTLEDVWNKNIEIDELETLGYLSWEELKIMDKEGLMDVQSHTMSHSWYPINDNIIDFRHPDDSYIWNTWNNYINEKPYLHTDNEELINLGQPVYENGRSIGIKCYYPDKKIDSYLVKYVKEHGEKLFFESESWKNILFDITNDYKNRNSSNGRYESKKEYEERIYYEIYESKKIIENNLKKEIKFLCWPGGAVTNEALKIASNVGYISSTVGKDLTNEKKYLKNVYGEDPKRINRIGISIYWNGLKGSKSKIKYKNGLFLILSLYNFQNKGFISKFSYMALGACSWIYKFKYFLNI